MIGDVRNLLQDFLAPELRAIAVRIDNVERLLSATPERLEKSQNAAVERLESSQNAAIERLEHQRGADMLAINKRFDEVISGLRGMQDYVSVTQRLSKVEAALEARH